MFLNKAAEDHTGIFTEPQLIHNCMDIFLAGSETTSKSLLVRFVFGGGLALRPMVHYLQSKSGVYTLLIM
jgi:hypothetical protein